MSDKPKSQNQDKFIVRLPDGMRERISVAADAAGCSMNAEIVSRLQDSFDTTEETIVWHRMIELKRLNRELARLHSEIEDLKKSATGDAAKIASLQQEIAWRADARMQAIYTLNDLFPKVVGVGAGIDLHDADAVSEHVAARRKK